MLAITLVGTVDEEGGAAVVSAGLMRGYAAHGHRVRHVVGRKRGSDPHVLVLPDDDRLPFRASGYVAVQAVLRRLAGRFPDRGFGLLSRTLRLATHPRAFASRLSGREDFDFPGTRRLLDLTPDAPDVVHAHNLHGGYFDLRALAAISARVPTVLTLHDMWLLTGHCAHSLDCGRWATGCGQCPDLRLEPAVRRDATAGNWQRKRAIYAASRLFLATPSQWLADKVKASMLSPHVGNLRVIPNGVDTAIFQPADRQQVRVDLGLPVSGRIVLLTTGSRGSMWKDDGTLRQTMARLSERPAMAETLFVAVGRDSAVAVASGARTRSIPFQHDPRVMAQYYQAADVYLHAARADTHPLAVLEAMACGTPVVATAVGGVPEQITAVSALAVRTGGVGRGTGVLVPPGDAAQMADAAEALLTHDAARAEVAANGVADVAARFDVERQVATYLNWFQDIAKRGQ